MRPARSLIPFCALAALSACAAPAAPDQTRLADAASGARECFNAHTITGFSEGEGAVIRVSPSPSRTFDLTLTGPGCDDVGWAQAIAIDPSPGPNLCTGEGPGQGRVLFRDAASGSRVTRCQITAVTPVRRETGRP